MNIFLTKNIDSEGVWNSCHSVYSHAVIRPSYAECFMTDKFSVTIKLSRCDAKIVTSFLLIPAVSACALLFLLIFCQLLNMLPLG